MDNILLLMPFFRDYEQCLKKALEQRYQVTLVNCDQYNQEIVEKYLTIRRKMRHIRAVPAFRNRIDIWNRRMACNSFNDTFLSAISSEENAYQGVLCINCQCVGDHLLRRIRKNNPTAKMVYYLWDDIWNLFHLPETSCFDRVLSYNIDECHQKKWEYLPVFTQNVRLGHAENNEYDVALIGTAHPSRVKLANQIFKRYADQYRIFIYLYDPKGNGGQFCHTEPLNYDEYLEIMRKSSAFIDDPNEGQTGPTTRVFDALLTDTKILTTNTSIRHYPVYSQNITIIDRNHVEIPPEFLSQPYYKSDYQALTADDWLESIGL